MSCRCAARSSRSSPNRHPGTAWRAILFLPLPLREREGTRAKHGEGEGARRTKHHSAARYPLSRKGRGNDPSCKKEEIRDDRSRMAAPPGGPAAREGEG